MAAGSNAMERLERANIDMQIQTAKAYPRSIQSFKTRAMEMVSQDEETAESCIYRRPVGEKNGVVEYAEGKSIRMAEIVAACYGNIRVGAKIVEVDPKGRFVKAMGAAHDLENNVSASSEVIESTVKQSGQPYSERMRIVVAKAALSKARRDATFMVVPGALCKSLEDAARKVVIGDVTTLAKRREAVMGWLKVLGVDLARVWACLDIAGPEDIGLTELETLTGLKTAIKEGMSVEEAFPGPEKAPVQMPTKKGAKTEPPSAPVTPPAAVSPPDAETPKTIIAETRALIDVAKASKVQKAMKAAGIAWDDGEDWLQCSIDKIKAVRSFLKC
jgi:hypothetical protein